ncbi:DoxX family protein [Sphingobium sp. DC-2]|uniref:DoxX family protein n=1 Tax=Sphingobium sp. DC-2 TaxID=1303256 RepID=UPI0009E04A0B|nr:DoxX family protein [Sphingobium sp. DC-2]
MPFPGKQAAPPPRHKPEGNARRRARWLLSAFYMVAGLAHLLRPAGFLAIMPPWVPWSAQVVALTGAAEIAGAVGLHIPRLRRAAGAGLALYALCVWPANFHHAISGIPLGGVDLGWRYHGPRLALQPVIIWWALWASRVIDWPFLRRA